MGIVTPPLATYQVVVFAIPYAVSLAVTAAYSPLVFVPVCQLWPLASQYRYSTSAAANPGGHMESSIAPVSSRLNKHRFMVSSSCSGNEGFCSGGDLWGKGARALADSFLLSRQILWGI